MRRIVLGLVVVAACTHDYGLLEGRRDAAIGEAGSGGQAGDLGGAGSGSSGAGGGGGGPTGSGGLGGTGAAAGTTGTAGSGGQGGTGAAAGTSGTAGTGGRGGTGGAAAGATGSAASGGRGGTGGAAGATGSAGSGGTGGAAGTTGSGGRGGTGATAGTTGTAGSGGRGGGAGTAGAGGGSGTGGSIQIQQKCQSDTSTSNIAVIIKIVNNSNQTIRLSDVTVRYWFSHTTTATPVFSVDYSQAIPASAISGTFTSTYVQVAFAMSAGSLMAFDNINGSGELQLRFYPTDFSSWDPSQADDWSFQMCAGTAYNAWMKTTAYVGGVLAWGTEPP